MRNLFILLSLAAFTFVIACATPEAASGPASKTAVNAAAPDAVPAQPAAVQDDAPRISLEDAKKAFDAGTAVFVDVRAAEIYKQEHVKGAINVNFENWEKKLKHVTADKTVITYCSCPNEHSAANMVTEMQKKGMKNVSALLGGTMAWKDAGYPMGSGDK